MRLRSGSLSPTISDPCPPWLIARGQGSLVPFMTLFQLCACVLILVAVFGYLNHRFVQLPATVGNTAVGLVVSASLIAVGFFNPELGPKAAAVIERINFSEVVFHGLLPLLLFASALHVDFQTLRPRLGRVFVLATLGVVVSTVVVGYCLNFALSWVGVNLPLVWCLMFGALISPTDPVAVLSVLKSAKTDEDLTATVTGESLFNDGTGVVAFLILLGLAMGAQPLSTQSVVTLLFREILGGLAAGYVVGFATLFLLKGVDSYPVEILMTLACAVGGYALAEGLHVSPVLTVVTAGLLVGNRGTRLMSELTREHLFSFWELLDELLNIVLFGLIGVLMVALSFSTTFVFAALIAIPVTLFARWVSVSASLALAARGRPANATAVRVLTWGGLRGGISLALALSLPAVPARPLLVTAAFGVVLFSLLVQAMTLKRVVQGRPLSRQPT